MAPPPAACTLGTGDAAARVARWRRLTDAAQRSVRRSGPVLEVRFRDAPDVRAELEELVAAERLCCGFLSWSVTHGPAPPVLRVVARPDAPEELDAIAGLVHVG